MPDSGPPDHPDNQNNPDTTVPYVHWVPGPEVLRVPPAELPPGWSRPRPELLPRATCWPSVLAFGITLVVWGPENSWVMTVVGLVFVIAAIRGWILELINEAETPE